jgi:membrane protein DedA with SNARE-associated domain
MLTLSIVSLLVGAGLGQHYRVLVLVPATAILLGVAVVTGAAQAQTAWSIVLMGVAAATCIQIGYFVGVGIHHVLVANWSSGTSPLTSSTSTSAR